MEDSGSKPLSDHDSVTPLNDHSQSDVGNGPSIRVDGETETMSKVLPQSISGSHNAPESHGQTSTPETPSFPHLRNNSPSSPRAIPSRARSEAEDEESATAQCFQRSSSPSSSAPRNKYAEYHNVGEKGICKMHKFSLYETASRYYLVGGDIVDKKFRILKIDRTAELGSLSVAEDEIVYTKKEMNQLLNAVDDGNKSSGGLKLKCTNWGLLGFIRFTGAYYMLVITKRSQVALIGGHYIYQVDGTDLVPLTTSSSARSKSDRDPEEIRFIGILNNLDLSRSFYFSYSYNITRTLQQNIIHEREALQRNPVTIPQQDHNSMFVWNHYLLQPVFQMLKNPYDWCLPIIHGFIDQASKSTGGLAFTTSMVKHRAGLSIYGRSVYITLIARRSRYFAGARFLKRGVNDLVLVQPVGT